MTGIFRSRQWCCVSSSVARGAGAGKSTPGDELGVFSSPSFDPKTPMSASVLS